MGDIGMKLLKLNHHTLAILAMHGANPQNTVGEGYFGKYWKKRVTKHTNLCSCLSEIKIHSNAMCLWSLLFSMHVWQCVSGPVSGNHTVSVLSDKLLVTTKFIKE